MEPDRLEEWAQGLVDKAKVIDMAELAESSLSIYQITQIAFLTGYAQSASQFIKNKKEQTNE